MQTSLDPGTNRGDFSDVTRISNRQGYTAFAQNGKVSSLQIVGIPKHVPRHGKRERVTKFVTASIRSAGERYNNNRCKAGWKAEVKYKMTREDGND